MRGCSRGDQRTMPTQSAECEEQGSATVRAARIVEPQR